MAMQCDFSAELMSAYVDGELPPEQQAQLTEHVKECPRCARLRAEFASTKTLLRQRIAWVEVPAQFWAQVRRRLDAIHAPTRPHVRPLSWQHWAVAAAAACAILIASWRIVAHLSPRPEPLVPAELAHVYLTHRDTPCAEERAVRDPAEGARWLTTTVGYHVPAVNYESAGFELSHVTTCVCFSVPASAPAPKGAVLAYRQRQQDWRVCLFVHPTSVFDVPRGQRLRVGRQNVVTAQAEGCNVISWRSGDLIYSIVSDLPQEALLKLSRIKPCAR